MKLKLSFAGLALAFLFSGLTVSQLQTPKILDEGKWEIGSEFNTLYYIAFAGSIWVRYGLGSNLDFGLRTFGFPGLYADLKYQAKNSPYLAGNLGIGYAREGITGLHILTSILASIFASIFGGGSAEFVSRDVIAIHPSLILGGERFYISGRLVAFSSKIVEKSSGKPVGKHQTVWPGISLGYTFGKKFRITPEVSIFYGKLWKDIETKSNFLVFPALGISIRP